MLPKQTEIAQANSQVGSTECPRVSVIIGVYNHERYVMECLDSIPGTSYSNLEMIVMNDCSSDASHEVVQAWIKAHPTLPIVYITHEQNLGLTRTLNEAITLATGEYICLIAADDVMLPNGIIDRLEYLQQHPNKLAVFADCHVIDEHSARIYDSGIEQLFPEMGMRKQFLRVEKLLAYSIVFHWAMPGPVFMCHRSLFDLMGRYDESLLVEDWDMYIRAATAGKLGFCDTYVANYRVHQQSMMRQNRVTRQFQPSITRTIEKHLRTTRGLIHLRLYAIRVSIAYDAEQRRWYKAGLWVHHKILLTLSNRLYLFFRVRLMNVDRKSI